MSTRAVYTFRDEDSTHHVYRHHDGYPTGAADALAKALPHAWELPRFEADEFAAAFVAGNKGGGGSVRLLASGNVQDVAPGDIEFRYEISMGNAPGQLRVNAYATNYWSEPRDTFLFNCSLDDFLLTAERWEAAERAA